MTKAITHPYLPNTNPEIKAQMLKEIGVESIEELYQTIPEELRYTGKLNIPEALNEFELKREVGNLLQKNKGTNEVISFLGGGCWQHFIPAVCDEIASRAEFVTAYAGDEYEDHGRFQVLFEYQSLLAELLCVDVVNVPTFDWGQAAATAIRMASRLTTKKEALVPKTVAPERLKIIENYCSPDVEIKLINYQEATGELDLTDLKNNISEQTAAIYFENPSYLGFLETQGEEISRIAKESGAITIVGVDPISLGVLESPVQYGADIICGELQPLGNPMNYGGGQSGFIATRDEMEYISEFPSRLFGITPTSQEGEYGFGDVFYDRTSFAKRENGKESVGTQTSMCAITAGVYLALMGPEGMAELGQTIMQRSQYAMKKLNEIEKISPSYFNNVNFKEFVVDFNETGKTVEEINQYLLSKGIYGGIDLSEEFPELGQSALFCVTEVHSKADIDTLAKELRSYL
ncbi:aminomethyl-transferring glycine dehydrogenase subunit GcvPA [Oceanobacillus neutriphilus]|uniref:Glycine dehydrogenase n=1 Tax=Oceanobacillus neutriphilus TaxID=531815 RepID=A0ABQ2NYU7_9BACI|nr:aminomethyl-transferring glycine dehydrogenase subunit GcvPA [Oceanobacillus neutriphilus]GGP13963.1 glycine dehydrogenase [Oceanobacillus neutriphilus]